MAYWFAGFDLFGFIDGNENSLEQTGKFVL
jgi:hypothetical protein